MNLGKSSLLRRTQGNSSFCLRPLFLRYMLENVAFTLGFATFCFDRKHLGSSVQVGRKEYGKGNHVAKVSRKITKAKYMT